MMLIARARRGAVVLAVAASAALCLAGTITTFGPATKGSVGTQFDIDGTGFGTKKPKVALVNDVLGITLPLKVSKGFGDTHVSAVLSGVRSPSKPPQGDYAVVVTPAGKGAVAITSAGKFTLLLPSVTTTPVFGYIGETQMILVVEGHDFGAVRGKVTHGGVAAKIKVWTDTHIEAVVSKKTPARGGPILVINGVGQAASPAAVHMLQSKAKAPSSVSAQLRSSLYLPKTVNIKPLSQGYLIETTQSLGNLGSRKLTIDITNTVRGNLPATLVPRSITYTEEPPTGTPSVWSTDPDDQALVTFGNQVEDRVQGKFTAHFLPVSGPDATGPFDADLGMFDFRKP